MLNAEIIAIGSEMLTPFRVDTNSLWLTERLNAMGIDVKLKTVVGDDEARLEETIRDAMKRSEIVISTGGLGPTEDDITRKIFARVLKRQLILEQEILDKSERGSRVAEYRCLKSMRGRRWSSTARKFCITTTAPRPEC